MDQAVAGERREGDDEKGLTDSGSCASGAQAKARDQQAKVLLLLARGAPSAHQRPDSSHRQPSFTSLLPETSTCSLRAKICALSVSLANRTIRCAPTSQQACAFHSGSSLSLTHSVYR